MNEEEFYKKGALKSFTKYVGASENIFCRTHKDGCFYNYNNCAENVKALNPLSTNPTKWSNTLKQFV